MARCSGPTPEHYRFLEYLQTNRNADYYRIFTREYSARMFYSMSPSEFCPALDRALAKYRGLTRRETPFDRYLEGMREEDYAEHYRRTGRPPILDPNEVLTPDLLQPKPKLKPKDFFAELRKELDDWLKEALT